MGHTVPLAELREGDSAAFGGKSATLGELLAAGIPVPPGFAVSTSAYRAFVEHEELRETIDAELARVVLHDVGDDRAGRGRDRRRDPLVAPVPDALREEIAGRWPSSVRRRSPSARARSARTAAEATFAGQQDTYLWVRGVEAVCAAVRDCWASLYGAPAIAYRARLGGAELPEMGVAVQVMVDAEVSGVMFTCNPVSGDPSVVAINASWGLGLAVVGGEVTPDDFLVSKITGEVVRRQIAEKTVRYVAGEHGAERTEVPEELRSASCLDDAALATLVEVGCRVDRYFGARQDIEWAFAPDRELHVLQVTAGDGSAAARAGPPPGSAIDLVMGAFGVGEGPLMPLDDDDVREILRLIDESELDELQVESQGFSLHVVRGAADRSGALSPIPPRPRRVSTASSRSSRRCSGRSTGRTRRAQRRSSMSGHASTRARPSA